MEGGGPTEVPLSCLRNPCRKIFLMVFGVEHSQPGRAYRSPSQHAHNHHFKNTEILLAFSWVDQEKGAYLYSRDQQRRRFQTKIITDKKAHHQFIPASNSNSHRYKSFS